MVTTKIICFREVSDLLVLQELRNVFFRSCPVIFMNMARSVKSIVKAITPKPLLLQFQKLWRAYYWSRRSKIDSRKNAKVITKVLAGQVPIKLELGSSRRPGRDDWIFSDISGGGDIQLDFTDPIPFPDSSIDYIYSSHILEHFSYPHPMLDFLSECRRILKFGASFSIAVPNAKLFLDAYARPQAFDKDKYCSWDVGLKYQNSIDFVNFIAYMGGDHKHLFDTNNLVTVLEEVGFRDVHIRTFDPGLDLEVRKHESIYAVAIK